MILVKIAGFEGTGDATVKGYDDGNWFVADSFSFGIDRELVESGEHGGSADINIGVGELQLVRITKTLNRASPKLAQLAVSGNSPGAIEIHFVATQGKQGQPYLAYKLDRCFVKSWSTSGDADDRPTEEVAFYYNRIAFQYGSVDPFSFDIAANRPWPDHGLQPLPEPKR